MATVSRTNLLRIYLNDHLAGATAGVELARRLARAHRDGPEGDTLDKLALEISEDRLALLEIMAEIGVSVAQYKTVAAWLAERLARLKPNGALVRRSPLSSVLELEAMRLGVEGKAAGWRSLRAIAETDERLDRVRLDNLLARARRQAETLETLRVRAAAAVFGEAFGEG